MVLFLKDRRKDSDGKFFISHPLSIIPEEKQGGIAIPGQVSVNGQDVATHCPTSQEAFGHDG